VKHVDVELVAVSATSTPHLRREAVVAALLVGCVVVLLGLASGLGLTAPAAPVAAVRPAVSFPPASPAETTTPALAPPVAPPTAYVAVPPPPAPVLAASAPSVTVTSPAPAPTVSRGAGSPPMPRTPSPSPTRAPSPVSCPAGLLSSLLDVLDRTLSGDLITGLLGAVLGGLDLAGLGPVATLTPQQRASDVRAAVFGPLRAQASAAGSPAAVSAACAVTLDERIAAATR
jgi:hypothetical protein